MAEKNKEQAENNHGRRAFFKTSLSGLGWAALAGLSPVAFARTPKGKSTDLASPIRTLSGSLTPDTFTGDNPTKAHGVLWNKSAYLAGKGGLPTPTENASIVIIGGGHQL